MGVNAKRPCYKVPQNLLLFNRVEKGKSDLNFHWKNNVTLFGTRAKKYVLAQCLLLHHDLMWEGHQGCGVVLCYIDVSLY